MKKGTVIPALKDGAVISAVVLRTKRWGNQYGSWLAITCKLVDGGETFVAKYRIEARRG